MTTKTTIKNLAAWIDDIKEAAKDDNCFSVAWFKDTEDKPFSIVAGWLDGFSEKYADLFYLSKSNPEYAMCLKIVVNDNQACPDFETLEMPVDKDGDVDDTSLVLEQYDDSEELATWVLGEWERITKEHTV